MEGVDKNSRSSENSQSSRSSENGQNSSDTQNHSDSKNSSRRLTVILFAVYMVILTWIILFKFSFGELPHLRGVNLIPFAGSVIVNGRLFYSELILNVLAFIPFGAYMSMINPEYPVCKRVLWIATVSLAYEVLQFVFAIGATDITDFINNTLGGFLGCMLYLVFSKVFRERANKVLNALALIGTVGIVMLMALLVVYNI